MAAQQRIQAVLRGRPARRRHVVKQLIGKQIDAGVVAIVLKAVAGQCIVNGRQAEA